MCESGYGIDPGSGQCVDLCSLHDSASCGAISGCAVSRTQLASAICERENSIVALPDANESAYSRNAMK